MKEKLTTLLNQKKNDRKFGFNVEYYSEKEENPFQWKVLLEGTQGSIYEGGFYMLKVEFPINYPASRPSVYFLNRIFHPHVDTGGEETGEENKWNGYVCLDLKPDKYEIDWILKSVKCMFKDYNKDILHAYPQKPREILKENPDKFKEIARDWVRKYAKMKDIDK